MGKGLINGIIILDSFMPVQYGGDSPLMRIGFTKDGWLKPEAWIRALHKISEREDISKISFRFWRNNIFKIFYLFKKIEEIYIWKNIFSPDQKILYFSKYFLPKIEKIFFQNNIFIFSKIEEIIYFKNIFSFSKNRTRRYF